MTAIPTPITDQSSDNFFMWEPFSSRVAFVSAVGFQHRVWERYELDSKAQRKVDDGDTLVVTLENSATVGMIFVLEFRVLIKNHA